MFFHRLKCKNLTSLNRNLNTKSKSLKSSKLIRQEFLDYFTKENNHAFIRSSPVVPFNDPSIPFVNAGMNQFKGVLLGNHSPPAFRVANSQKCIRVGGKHNDLNIVGSDSYHHTFFEMLGNWSFGDYFKKEACTYAWDLLTKIYGIRPEFLYVTYFNGNEKLGLKPDLDTKEIWLEIGVPKERILPFGIEENFWEMGPSGPCGPCTEIHIDHAMQLKNQAFRVNKGHDDVTELWNIVFIQYQRLHNGQIVPLPTKHIDTGMGFERLVSVLQEKRSNYDTDLFQPLFEVIAKLSKAPSYQGRFGMADKDKIDSGYRILADHSRMITIALADGMLPDKNHKLRKVLRKAIDISQDTFKTNKLLIELTNHVAASLGDYYPEIQKNLCKVQYIIQYEEDVMKSARNNALKNWRKVLDVRPELHAITDPTLPGLTAGYHELQSLLKSEIKVDSLSGEFAYKLYDTYGLDLETIVKLAEVESISFDQNAFKEAIEKARERSRLEAGKSDNEIISEYSLKLLESGKVPKTDDSFKYNYSCDEDGYHFPIIKSRLIGMLINGNLISQSETTLKVDEIQAVVEATVTSSGNIVEKSSVVDADSEVGIILDRTPAYSPAGSQVSDKGYIQIKDLFFKFEKVRKIRDYIIHIGYFADWEGKNPDHELRVGEECLISIDEENRLSAMRNHTAAHLLNAALKKSLPVVGQRGSTIERDWLLLEYSIFGRKLTTQDLLNIENDINQIIKADVSVKTKTVNILQMLRENDVTVIPGEVYPDNGIRIVEINSTIMNSKEACCGTHVLKTGSLEHFCITKLKSQGTASVSIMAVTGPMAHLTRLAGQNLKERIAGYKADFKAGKSDSKELQLIVHNEKLDLIDKRKRCKYPWIEVQEGLAELELLLKNMRIRGKGKKRNGIEEEISKVLQLSLSSPFVIHCLQPNNVSIENVTLKNIIKLCPQTKPVLALIHSKNKVKATCFVPQAAQTNGFNAKLWMEEIIKVFKSSGDAVENENPLTFFNMSPTHFPSGNIKALIDRAVMNASKFASTHVNLSRKNEPK